MPKVSICILTHGNYPDLARRAVESVRSYFPRSQYHLVVGANEVGRSTRSYLQNLSSQGIIDHLVSSPTNLNKNPMMGLMLARVEAEYVWWFDDDSYVAGPEAWLRWMRAAETASPSVVQWGMPAVCDAESTFTDVPNAVEFVRQATWYRGLPPPSWRPGGRGEMDYQGQGTGDGRWFFILGGCWLMRTRALRELDWPDPRLVKLGDDVFLGEAIRQHGWQCHGLGTPGIGLNTEPRRGDPGPAALASTH